ncbi:FkbM family methyltransferase [Candidatus Pelagibacter sp.]|nr:FkbM family methyltransferase [Candidatus Pelagibacter sp.]
MFKKFSYILYIFLKFIDYLAKFFFKRSLLLWISEFIHNDSYHSIKILNKKINFFVPNQIIKQRVQTFFTKEPETLKWIDNFNNENKFVLWDIGSNIGLYSIYAALKHNNCEIISFEPSTSNLRTLSRNISINNLENKIKIFTNPLSNKKDKFLKMKEEKFLEGGALNSFGEEFNFEGKKFDSKMNYYLLGKSINSILENNILKLPSYIKIDVDGIEHLILEGGDKFLKHENILSLLVEVNENFTDQFERVLKIMKESNFKVLHKRQNERFTNRTTDHSNTYNYVFIR